MNDNAIKLIEKYLNMYEIQKENIKRFDRTNALNKYYNETLNTINIYKYILKILQQNNNKQE